MLTKEEFQASIVKGIKAGRLDPCNGVEFGEIYTDRPQYYWTVEDNQVIEESSLYVDDEQPEFRFGITISNVEEYAEKDFGELSDDEIKQALLDIVDEYGVDDWYDQYQQSLETEV
jgi:hypothetical protein